MGRAKNSRRGMMVEWADFEQGSGVIFLHWSYELLLLQCDEPDCRFPTPLIALKKNETTTQELRKAVEAMPIFGALACRQFHQISRLTFA
jgi:hypothetical protein